MLFAATPKLTSTLNLTERNIYGNESQFYLEKKEKSTLQQIQN